MFLPIRDRLPTRRFPFINYLLIISNVLAFLWEQALAESGYEQIGNALGFVPYQFNHDPIATAPIFTSMFMHASWLHLGGNMLALWIFGDNVEDAIGHFRYLAFYLVGGVAAALTQMFMDPSSTVPMVGASGAIAAVMAGYLALYPTSPITVINPVFILWFFFGIFLELPAWVIALEFFVVNLLSGMSARASAHNGMGGVAFFAHVGGFIAGFLLVRFFMIGRTKQQADRWSGWRPPPRRRADGWDDYHSYR